LAPKGIALAGRSFDAARHNRATIKAAERLRLEIHPVESESHQLPGSNGGDGFRTSMFLVGFHDELRRGQFLSLRPVASDAFFRADPISAVSVLRDRLHDQA